MLSTPYWVLTVVKEILMVGGGGCGGGLWSSVWAIRSDKTQKKLEY